MNNSTDPVSGLVRDGDSKHAMAHNKNPSGEKGGKDPITKSIKTWIIKPMLLFHMGGFTVLSIMTGFFLANEPSSPWAWPALIAAFAGLPFGFASNVKKLVESFTGST